MKRLSQILLINNDDELFDYIQNSFRKKITTWDYFVNWKKVFDNLKPIEKELNLLNYLIGKEDIEKETSFSISDLLKENNFELGF